MNKKGIIRVHHGPTHHFAVQYGEGRRKEVFVQCPWKRNEVKGEGGRVRPHLVITRHWWFFGKYLCVQVSLFLKKGSASQIFKQKTYKGGTSSQKNCVRVSKHVFNQKIVPLRFFFPLPAQIFSSPDISTVQRKLETTVHVYRKTRMCWKREIAKNLSCICEICEETSKRKINLKKSCKFFLPYPNPLQLSELLLQLRPTVQA